MALSSILSEDIQGLKHRKARAKKQALVTEINTITQV